MSITNYESNNRRLSFSKERGSHKNYKEEISRLFLTYPPEVKQKEYFTEAFTRHPEEAMEGFLEYVKRDINTIAIRPKFTSNYYNIYLAISCSETEVPTEAKELIRKKVSEGLQLKFYENSEFSIAQMVMFLLFFSTLSINEKTYFFNRLVKSEENIKTFFEVALNVTPVKPLVDIPNEAIKTFTTEEFYKLLDVADYYIYRQYWNNDSTLSSIIKVDWNSVEIKEKLAFLKLIYAKKIDPIINRLKKYSTPLPPNRVDLSLI